MPVTLTKVKPKTPKTKTAEPVALVDPTELPLEDLADRYGELQDKLMALQHNPLFAQFEDVEKALKARLKDYEPDQIVEIKGKHWIVEAGACSLSPRKITDPLKVMNYIGSEAFAAIAKVGVSDAEKYLTPEQFAAVSWPTPDTPKEEKYTANRKIAAKYLG